MLSSGMLALIEKRLRDWQGNNRPFGGVAIILLGDFFQIPTVGGGSLFFGFASRPVVSSPTLEAVHVVGDLPDEARGIELFRAFSTVHFTRQQRANDANDKSHLDMLLAFRNPAKALAPVANSGLFRVPVLSAADVDRDPLWHDAVFVTSSNMCRRAINQQYLLRFATRTGVPIIAWRHRLSKQTLQYLEGIAAKQQRSVSDVIQWYYPNELIFYFAHGAPAVITTNVATDKRLCNGTDCKLYSVRPAPEDVDSLNSELATASPGQLIWLSHPPESVNVEMPERDGSGEPLDWASFGLVSSLVPGKTVIPLLQNTSENNFIVPLHRIKGTKKTPFLRYYDHSVELAFSLTFHKVQGKTIPRVVLDLRGKGNLISVASLYVGVSRSPLLPFAAFQSQRLHQGSFDKTRVQRPPCCLVLGDHWCPKANSQTKCTKTQPSSRSSGQDCK